MASRDALFKRKLEGNDGEEECSPSKTRESPNGAHKAMFLSYLKGLNRQFAKWIRSQETDHVSEIWSDGVRDYLEHADQLLKGFQDIFSNEDCALGASGAYSDKEELKGSANRPEVTDSVTEGISSTSSLPSTAPASNPIPTAPSFNFGPASSSGSTVSSTPAFAFGGASSSLLGQAPFGSSIFGQSSSPSMFGQAPFSFGSGSAAISNAAVAEGEEEEAPSMKYESEVQANDESGTIIFKEKAKMYHYKKDEEGKPTWDTKGVGMVILRTPKEEERKPFVTFTTEAGRVLYIANIPKTMKLIVNESGSNISWSAPWSPDGVAPPKLEMVRFMFAKGKGRQDDLKAEIEKLQEQMES